METTLAGSSTTHEHKPLQGRVAIVTGASRGIGRTIALHLASLGASVVINYATSSTQADLLAAEINSASSNPKPPRAITVQANVANAAQVKSLFDHAEKAFGIPQIHILVNCAGVLDSKYPTLAATREEDWDMTFDVNTKGSFLCSREAANRLIHGGGGRIINMSSSMVGGLRPGYATYTASKAAVEAMTRILAKELKGTQITANCVAPGPVATEMFFAGKSDEAVKRVIDESPLSRLGETKDIAPLVGFLATDGGEWVNGQVIRVNGGYV
ncbi:NADPH-dependent aldehyde reductase-like protein, chloroplastic [Tasmannia lanceolata]|uniref:NADPH-dependent aldehyde reductase-like protein, chloroplastic n=1 Tax=Tasmannia lanceolata TaxID=3420 RepID=UPI0040638395